MRWGWLMVCAIGDIGTIIAKCLVFKYLYISIIIVEISGVERTSTPLYTLTTLLSSFYYLRLSSIPITIMLLTTDTIISIVFINLWMFELLASRLQHRLYALPYIRLRRAARYDRRWDDEG